jgi:hypothetical protein
VVVRRQQVDGLVAGDEADSGMRLGGRQQRLLDRRAGVVRRVDDARQQWPPRARGRPTRAATIERTWGGR